MTEPTDAEIVALNAGEIHFSESPTKCPEAGHGTQYHAGAPGVLSFARAVLAKWGTPTAVGVEPVAYVEVSQTDSEVSMTWGPEPAGFDLPSGRHALFTSPQPTQAQAGAVPLTDAQIDQAIAELSLNYLADAHATNRAVLQKLCRHAHGIKGGQHAE